MTLRQFEVFLAVARARSFRRAAEALHLSQPALSQHVRERHFHVIHHERRRLSTAARAFMELFAAAAPARPGPADRVTGTAAVNLSFVVETRHTECVTGSGPARGTADRPGMRVAAGAAHWSRLDTGRADRAPSR
jgi:hypothetical protein